MDGASFEGIGDGAKIGTYAMGDGPEAMVFDGSNIWVANQNSNSVTKLRASDGTALGTYAVGKVPAGLAYDGANIWVWNYGSRDPIRRGV